MYFFLLTAIDGKFASTRWRSLKDSYKKKFNIGTHLNDERLLFLVPYFAGTSTATSSSAAHPPASNTCLNASLQRPYPTEYANTAHQQLFDTDLSENALTNDPRSQLRQADFINLSTNAENDVDSVSSQALIASNDGESCSNRAFVFDKDVHPGYMKNVKTVAEASIELQVNERMLTASSSRTSQRSDGLGTEDKTQNSKKIDYNFKRQKPASARPVGSMMSACARNMQERIKHREPLLDLSVLLMRSINNMPHDLREEAFDGLIAITIKYQKE